MSADLQQLEQEGLQPRASAAQPPQPTSADDEDLQQEDSEEEDEEEPKLKYVKLTGSLTNVYRNGDSTSAFVVAGDKMALGTHNGNIHVLSLPTLKSLRTYHAHSATITSLSISPTPPPPSHILITNPTTVSSPPLPSRSSTAATNTTSKPRPQQPQNQATAIPNTPSNNIYIATSSLDGHVCISSLLDSKDVQLRNFARPVSSVALSPQYRIDRTYLSGGLAGQLILTEGGRAGVTVDANTNSAAAAASGWLGSIGLATDKGRDEMLHQGEGGIKEIKWSLSGKWVCWINEEGIKIMRSHLKLGSEESEDAWRRIAHAEKPNKKEWEEFVGVWRGHVEWIDDRKLEADEDPEGEVEKGKNLANGTSHKSPAKSKKAARIEKLVVGWGDTAFILHVQEDRTTSPATGRRQVGKADIMRKVQFEDCIISGITLYSPSLIAILAYRTVDDDDNPIQQPDALKSTNGSSGKRKPRHRHTGLEPQVRLINPAGGNEDTNDSLPISRFQTLSAQDYHLSTLYIPPLPPVKAAPSESGAKAALEGIWDAAGGKYANRLFSSGTSVLSRSSSGADGVSSPPSSAIGVPITPQKKVSADVAAHPSLMSPGLKLFIQSPYDCVLAVRTGLDDRLKWLMEHERYDEAWKLVDLHPEVVSESEQTEKSSRPSTPGGKGRSGGSLADFFADDAASLRSGEQKVQNVEREKVRIGDLWLRQLVATSQWEEAGRVAASVLGTSSRWETWVWRFAEADKFDEIASFIPFGAHTHLPGEVYEVVLGHYVKADPRRLKELLDEWDPAIGLFDNGSVSKAIQARLSNEDEVVREGSEDWRLLTECLAKLYLADGKVREALQCWILAQNAEEAFRLLKDEEMLDGIAEDDVPGLIMLRVTPELMKKGNLRDLDQASEEAINLLVKEALRGTLMPKSVIEALQRKGDSFKPFLYFYFRGLWRGSPAKDAEVDSEQQYRLRRKADQLRLETGRAMVEDHADLAVELFAQYDRELLSTLLQASSLYSFDKAAELCDRMGYIPELVHIYSKTGQTKRALMLIIDELGDVPRAIQYAKDNPDLWDDLLDYSMDDPPKPAFIRGLLEEAGVAIDPIKLIRRIPERVEIEGLKQGIQKMMREYDVQVDISEGVARVLRGEVTAGMEILRAGRAKGVKFEVVHESQSEIELAVKDPPVKVDGGDELPVPKSKLEKGVSKGVRPGHCVGCGETFHEDEKETLIGFACGHVYHLSCLLKENPATNDPELIKQLLDQLGGGNDSADEGYSGRSVGMKVAHAHIIRNVVKGGCQHCIKVEAAA